LVDVHLGNGFESIEFIIYLSGSFHDIAQLVKELELTFIGYIRSDFIVVLGGCSTLVNRTSANVEEPSRISSVNLLYTGLFDEVKG
jgi:hypothetical protein